MACRNSTTRFFRYNRLNRETHIFQSFFDENIAHSSPFGEFPFIKSRVYIMKKTLFSAAVAGVLLSANAYAETKTAKTVPPKQPTPTIQNSQSKDVVESAKKANANNTNTQAKAEPNKPAETQTQAAKPASNTAASESKKETVVLQLGAFTDPNLAYRQAAKVSLMGVPAKVVRVKNKNGDYVRVVRSSQRLKQADAEKTAADLREQQVNVLLTQ